MAHTHGTTIRGPENVFDIKGKENGAQDRNLREFGDGINLRGSETGIDGKGTIGDVSVASWMNWGGSFIYIARKWGCLYKYNSIEYYYQVKRHNGGDSVLVDVGKDGILTNMESLPETLQNHYFVKFLGSADEFVDAKLIGIELVMIMDEGVDKTTKDLA